MDTPTNETYDQQREREQAEVRERTVNLFHFAASVAKFLSDVLTADTWTVVDPHPDREFEQQHPHLRRASDGAEFWIGLDWRAKDRIDVHGNWPKDATGREQRPNFSQYSNFGATAPSITFASGKTATVAARDIQRRFLAHFLPLWEQQAVVVQRQNEHFDGNKALAARLAVILKGRVWDAGSDRKHTLHLGYREHGIAAVEFEADPKSLKVEVRCTIEELEALTKLFPPTKGEGQ